MIELDQTLATRQFPCVRRILHAPLRIHDRENFRRRLDRALHDHVHLAQGLDRIVEQKNAGVERDETGRAQVREINVKQGQTDPERSNNFHERADRFHRHDHAHHVFELQLVAVAKLVFLMLLARERLDHADAGEGFLHRHDHLAHVFLLVLHGFARAFSIESDRHETARKSTIVTSVNFQSM